MAYISLKNSFGSLNFNYLDLERFNMDNYHLKNMKNANYPPIKRGIVCATVVSAFHLLESKKIKYLVTSNEQDIVVLYYSVDGLKFLILNFNNETNYICSLQKLKDFYATSILSARLLIPDTELCEYIEALIETVKITDVVPGEYMKIPQEIKDKVKGSSYEETLSKILMSKYEK